VAYAVAAIAGEVAGLVAEAKSSSGEYSFWADGPTALLLLSPKTSLLLAEALAVVAGVEGTVPVAPKAICVPALRGTEKGRRTAEDSISRAACLRAGIAGNRTYTSSSSSIAKTAATGAGTSTAGVVTSAMVTALSSCVAQAISTVSTLAGTFTEVSTLLTKDSTFFMGDSAFFTGLLTGDSAAFLIGSSATAQESSSGAAGVVLGSSAYPDALEEEEGSARERRPWLDSRIEGAFGCFFPAGVQ